MTFDILMNACKHSACTGAPAKIEWKAGGAFSCYGWNINWRTLELPKNKDIV